MSGTMPSLLPLLATIPAVTTSSLWHLDFRLPPFLRRHDGSSDKWLDDPNWIGEGFVTVSFADQYMYPHTQPERYTRAEWWRLAGPYTIVPMWVESKANQSTKMRVLQEQTKSGQQHFTIVNSGRFFDVYCMHTNAQIQIGTCLHCSAWLVRQTPIRRTHVQKKRKRNASLRCIRAVGTFGINRNSSMKWKRNNVLTLGPRTSWHMASFRLCGSNEIYMFEKTETLRLHGCTIRVVECSRSKVSPA